MKIKAIDTSYKGYLFRSRLEARWAVFFDLLPVEWEYEPEGFDLGDGLWYLPDFKVTYPQGFAGGKDTWWFEVKSKASEICGDDWQKLLRFESLLTPSNNYQSSSSFLILDGIPDLIMYKGAEALYLSLKAPNSRCGWSLWSGKQRPWWDEHENFFDDDYKFREDLFLLRQAVNAARSARFEHNNRRALA